LKDLSSRHQGERVARPLDELKEGFFPFERVAQDSFRFPVGKGERAVIWAVSMADGCWQVSCDEGERSFPSEGEACGYFWERARQPPSN
jgi:hypothetical protein